MLVPFNLTPNTGVDLVDEIFKLEKCGKGDPSFWNWCKDPDFLPRLTKCVGVKQAGDIMTCRAYVYFLDKRHLMYLENCEFAPNASKIEEVGLRVDLHEGEFDEITKYCKARDSLNWLFILIIILFIVSCLSISFWIFWRVYLRRRLYPTSTEQRQSTMTSRYTSTPTSSAVSASRASALTSLRTVNTSSLYKPRSTSRSRSKPKMSGS